VLNGLSPERAAEAVARVLQGEDPQNVARDLGVAPSAVKRAADDLIEPRDLKPLLERMAADFGLVARMEFPFALGVGSKIYTPDCVWFAGRVEPDAAVAIFEIEVATSPKHRAGGVAFANFVALSGSTRVRFFAITRERNRTLMANTVELFATKLQERWRLDAFVIPSFSPAVIRERVHAAFVGPAPSSPPNLGT
jgi:hypothetical protein